MNTPRKRYRVVDYPAGKTVWIGDNRIDGRLVRDTANAHKPPGSKGGFILHVDYMRTDGTWTL